MNELLMQDMTILVTARASKDAGFTVEEYLERYSEEGSEDRDTLKGFLDVMNLIEETYWVRDIWDEQYYKEKFVYFLVWK